MLKAPHAQTTVEDVEGSDVVLRGKGFCALPKVSKT